jgi:hypothetical protein
MAHQHGKHTICITTAAAVAITAAVKAVALDEAQVPQLDTSPQRLGRANTTEAAQHQLGQGGHM